MLEATTEELVVLLDSVGRSIGTMPKSRVHTSDTPLHSAFSVFLFDRQGYMLAQQRAWTKLTWPGVWSNACCGHPAPGEQHIVSAYRRIGYELGLGVIALEMVLPRFQYKAVQSGVMENEICPVLVGVVESNCEMMPNPAEVADVQWIRWNAFRQADENNLDCEFRAFSPWSLLEARALAESSRFYEIMEAMEVQL